MAKKVKIVTCRNTHLWWSNKIGDTIEVYENESDWPSEHNERGMAFDGFGTHYRLIEKELFILKSDCRDAEPKIISVEITHGAGWYINSVGICYSVFVDSSGWPEAEKGDFQYSEAEWYRTVDLISSSSPLTTLSSYINKSDCEISVGDSTCENKTPLTEWLNSLVVVPHDLVNKPKHYTDGKIEVIDFIEDKKLNFPLGNAVKYIARAGKKDPLKYKEDLQKAVWYLQHEIDKL